MIFLNHISCIYTYHSFHYTNIDPHTNIIDYSGNHLYQDHLCLAPIGCSRPTVQAQPRAPRGRPSIDMLLISNSLILFDICVIYIYIYIYIERERETYREREREIYVYSHIHTNKLIYIYIYIQRERGNRVARINDNNSNSDIDNDLMIPDYDHIDDIYDNSSDMFTGS